MSGRPVPSAGLDRRGALAIGLGAVALAAAPRASAAPSAAKSTMSTNDWLKRAALVLDESRRAMDWVAWHTGDAALAALALEIAEVRSDVAARMAPPVGLKTAHMHLLLVLENATASFDAAARGDAKRAAEQVANARTEEQTLKDVLDAARLKIPGLRG